MQEDIFTYSPLTYVGVESIRDLSILVVGLQNFRKKKKKNSSPRVDIRSFSRELSSKEETILNNVRPESLRGGIKRHTSSNEPRPLVSSTSHPRQTRSDIRCHAHVEDARIPRSYLACSRLSSFTYFPADGKGIGSVVNGSVKSSRSLLEWGDQR